MSEFERARSFTWANDDAGADRVEPWAHGTAVLTPSLDQLWDGNYLRAQGDPGLDARALAAESERVLGAAGASHRAVVVGEAQAGRRLQAGFAALGWNVDRLLFMFLRGAPATRPGAATVQEVSLDDLAELRHELHSAQFSSGAEVARQVSERDTRIRHVGHTRWFAVRAGADFVASCALLERDGLAEVDDVGTLPAYRGRGYARALVVAAAAEARASGADVFLGAYLDDWPQRFYRRLGFEPVGMVHRFRLHGPFTSPQPAGNI